MFDSLVRWLESGAGNGSLSARRFTPRLETLETRALPGAVSGGAVLAPPAQAIPLSAQINGPAQMHPQMHQVCCKHAAPGDGALLGITPFATRSSGEEIPQ